MWNLPPAYSQPMDLWTIEGDNPHILNQHTKDMRDFPYIIGEIIRYTYYSSIDYTENKSDKHAYQANPIRDKERIIYVISPSSDPPGR